MNPAYPCFQLVEFMPPNGLTGRNCGTELKVGMTFIRLRRTRHFPFRDAQSIRSEEVRPPHSISLKLERISSYGTALKELGSGMTALLEVSGDSLLPITRELAELSKDEYLSIEREP
jgi:hypothetical protein